MNRIPKVAVDPIEHVVVLMLENRSFDQMLGDCQQLHDDLDGVDRDAPKKNLCDGVAYQQRPTTVRCASNDPDHGLASVLRQIGAPPAVPGMDCRRRWWFILLYIAILKAIGSWLSHWWFRRIEIGRRRLRAPHLRVYEGHFVSEYVRKYPASSLTERDEVMGYYELGSLPAIHELARHFTICDRWFSSVPGPTWTNRFFVHSGTALGIVRMPDYGTDFENYAVYDQRTIYDELTDRGIKWRIYYHDVPQTLMLTNQWKEENARNYSQIEHFETDVAGASDDFPAYVFIEPQYSGDNANDDHPPYDIMRGQQLIARIYNALRANRELWSKTLMIVLYDEHGGYFDHVEPLKAPAPDHCVREYTFDRLGVRVPVVLVSPWVGKCVRPSDKSVHFDHTSIGKYLCEKWDLKPLGKRMKYANSIALMLQFDQPARIDEAPMVIPSTPVGTLSSSSFTPPRAAPPNENQVALDALSEYLDQKATGQPKPGALRMATRMKPDPSVQRARVARFLSMARQR